MTPTPVLDRPRVATVATIDVAADGWTFAANGTRASVRLIDGAYPDFSSIVGSGDEPVHVARAIDSASSPLFFTAGDGTRHVVMPMILGATESAAWKRREDAPVAEVAAEVASVDVPDPVEVEPEPEPVTPEESAFRTQRAANAR
jgi:hypothetical protein